MAWWTSWETDAAALTVLAMVSAGVVKIGRKGRRLSRLVDDFLGEEARPGVARRPGLMERTANIEQTQNENRAEMARQSIQLRALDQGQVEMLRRIGLVEAQVHPNGGGSMADKVNVIADAIVGEGSGSSS